MVSSDALNEYLKGFRVWLEDAGFELDTAAKWENWNGSVIIEWVDPNKGQSNGAVHNLSIILPPGFPYRAPIVISRDNPPLAPSWHLAPEPAHSLCLWDTEIGWQPHFTAQRLLNRIEDWFHYYHTDNWPLNSQVPDLNRYLESVGMVVIGDSWNPPDNKRSGKFIFWQPQSHSGIIPHLASCYEDDRVHHNPESRLADNLLPGVKSSKRLSGVWFRLVKPFVPPNNLRDLLCLIETDSGMEAGWARQACIRVVSRKITGGGFPIAIGYTDHQNEERWLFLWAQLAPIRKKRQKIPWSRLEGLAQIKLKSFQTAPARKVALLRRSAYLSKHLSSFKVTIFGVGALGGSVAVLLAKAGIGEICLVDDDILMPGNVMRHVCGLGLVGLQKAIAVKNSIHAHNPDCRVSCYDSTWEMESLRIYISECEVVIDTTANPNFSLYLNELCVISGPPVIFAASYRRAMIGRVIVRRNNSDPCLACYVNAAQYWHEDEYPIIPVDPEATFIEDGCGMVTEEAVALDVEAVANLTARIAVKVIQKQLGDENLAILVNEPLPNASGVLEQQGLHWWTNTPLENCLICRNS